MSEIRTRPATQEYRDNWSRIFGKKTRAEFPWRARDSNGPTALCPTCGALVLAQETERVTHPVGARAHRYQFTDGRGKCPGCGIMLAWTIEAICLDTPFVCALEGARAPPKPPRRRAKAVP